MPLTPEEQALVDRLNQQYPRISEITPTDFQRLSVDGQVDQVMQAAKNLRDFEFNRLMVPGEAELRYRANIKPPTSIDRPPPPDFRTEELSQYLTRQPRPITVPPPGIDPQPSNSDDLSQYLTRQPRPSSATPPPTPNTSGARVPQGMGDLPMPASPRTQTPTINPAIDAQPKSPPNPAGITPRALLGGVLVSTAFRVISGQSPQQALFGATGESLGSVSGAVVGSVLGPAGTFIGGTIGGFVGGRIADFIFEQTRPKKAELKSEPVTGLPPFTGGQSVGVLYNYGFKYDLYRADGVTLEYSSVIDFYNKPGAIQGARIIGPPGAYHFQVLVNGTWGTVLTSSSARRNDNASISYIVRSDGLPDIGGDPPPLPIQKDTRTRDSTNHPGNQDYAVPGGTPLSRLQRPTPDNYVPGGTASKSNGTPRGDSPDWISHGGPKGTPHPVNMPRPLVAPLPTVAPARSPSPNASPEDVNQPFPRSNNRPETGNFSPPDSVELRFPSAAPVSTTIGGQPIPDANKPAPITNPIGTGLTPLPTPESSAQIQEDLKKKIDELGLGLVAVTALIQGITNNTTPETLGPTIEKAVCRTTQPGGCTRNLTDDLKNGQNNLGNKLDAKDVADALAQAEQLRLLNQLDSKLGPQVTGGISGFLGRFAKSTHLDKIINALTLITTLHNAAMLSRNLGSTLGEVASQALAVIGIKDENDSPIDINEQLSKQVNQYLESLLGAEAWRGIKTNWNKASSIISSASNIVYTVRSLWDSSKEILEWTAENTGRIGNALKRFRVVGENAYRYMPEQVTHTNAWALKINRFREGTDSIDDAASSLSGVLGEVQNIQEEAKDLKEQKERFDKNLKDLTPKTRVENKPVADAVAASKAASIAPADAANVFRGEGESNA